jgi:hypothetical protein
MFVGKIVLNFPADMAWDGSDPLMRRTVDRLVVGQPGKIQVELVELNRRIRNCRFWMVLV